MIAHAGGSVDELVFLAAMIVFAGGLARALDKAGRRWVGPVMMVAAVGIGALGTAVRSGSPGFAPNRIASTARLEIVEPRSGRIVYGDTMGVALRLRGARITAGTSRTLRPDRGHVHLSLDGVVVSSLATLGTRISIEGIEPGPHLLQAEFVATDHGPFRPPVVATASFVVPM